MKIQPYNMMFTGTRKRSTGGRTSSQKRYGYPQLDKPMRHSSHFEVSQKIMNLKDVT